MSNLVLIHVRARAYTASIVIAMSRQPHAIAKFVIGSVYSIQVCLEVRPSLHLDK